MIDSYVPSPIPFYISDKRSDWRRVSCRDIPPYPQPVIAVADFSINIANGIDIRVESDPGPVTSVFLLPWGGGAVRADADAGVRRASALLHPDPSGTPAKAGVQLGCGGMGRAIVAAP